MVKCSWPQLTGSENGEQGGSDKLLNHPRPYAPVLPLEIILHIFDYTRWRNGDRMATWNDGMQPLLNTLSQVCRSWYAAFICYLYNSSHVKGSRYHRFVHVICAPVNAKSRRSGLAEHIKKLDLVAICDEGGGSPTAKLIRRVKSNLIEFMAPQVILPPSTLASLSKCNFLRNLDLASVPTMNMRLLFDALQNLRRLKQLRTPCQLINNDGVGWGVAYTWPPSLRNLTVYGVMDDAHPLFFEKFPRKLTHLAIASCPKLGCATVYQWLEATGRSLEYFEVCDWVPKSNTDNLDNIPWHLPLLRHLDLPHTCITWSFVLNMLRRRFISKKGRQVFIKLGTNLEILIIRNQNRYRRRPLTAVRSFGNPITARMMLILVWATLSRLETLKIYESHDWEPTITDIRYFKAVQWILDQRAQDREDSRRVGLMVNPYHGELKPDTCYEFDVLLEDLDDIDYRLMKGDFEALQTA